MERQSIGVVRLVSEIEAVTTSDKRALREAAETLVNDAYGAAQRGNKVEYLRLLRLAARLEKIAGEKP